MCRPGRVRLRGLYYRRLRSQDPGLAGRFPRWPPPWSSTRSASHLDPPTRERTRPEDVIHHTDRDLSTSIRFSERLAEAGIQPWWAVGSSYDNALAEVDQRPIQDRLIKPGKPWRSIEDVELATARWVDWFQPSPPLPSTAATPPVELRAAYRSA